MFNRLATHEISDSLAQTNARNKCRLITAMKETPTRSGAIVDHRALSAQKKRERMRDRILKAILAVCVNHGADAIIEDVLRTADVSRGTFYAHFDTLHAAIAAAGQQLADQEVRDLLALYADVTDPLFLCATGPQTVLAHAVVEPAWAYVLTQIDNFDWSSVFVSSIRATHAALLRLRGAPEAHDLDVLVDLNIAMMIHGARQLQNLRIRRWNYIQNASALLLQAMGIPEREAWSAVYGATENLKARGPGRLPWWRDFD